MKKVLLTVGVLLVARTAQGQTRHPPISVADALSRFSAEEIQASPASHGGLTALYTILSEPDSPPASVDSIVTGLEEIALSRTPPRLRVEATIWLGDAGHILAPRGVSVLPQLLRVFERTRDPDVRLTVLQSMPRQLDSPGAIAFLERVATSSPHDTGHSPDESWFAVSSLSLMGEPGRSALARLQRGHQLRDGTARGYVIWFFREESAGRTPRPEELHLRSDCRLAAQIVRTGEHAPRWAWGISAIRICGLEGPALLAPMWADNRLRAENVETVLNASSGIRDARLARAAEQRIRASTADPAVRIAAMILLVRYIDPQFGLAVELLREPAGWTPGHRIRPILGGRGSHAISQVDGAQPLPANLKASTVALLRAVSANDSDPRIQYVAGGLVLRLGGSLDQQ